MQNPLRKNAWLALWLISLGILICVESARAQEAASATLYPLQTEDFPHITANLDVHDAQGEFVHGLSPENVNILENGQAIPVDEITELHPGVQFVIAISPGSPFDIRDGQGVSRFDYLVQGMESWNWDMATTSFDDYSLVTSDGLEVIHRADPAEIMEALQGYQPDARHAIPNLEVLSRAIEIVSDPGLQPGMERSVLFITSPQLTDVTVGLQSLAARANQAGIHLSVWLVAPEEYTSLPEANQLRILTEQARGHFFTFSGNDPVPDLEGYLEPLRHIYNLAYISQITNSGSHEVAAQIVTDAFETTSPPQAMQLELIAPYPIFISLPAVITRTISTESSIEADQQGPQLVPTSQDLHIRIEFPDGYERELASSLLYVNGSIVAENTQPPFDQFTWDLRDYIANEQHILQVQIVDSLGLSGQSAEIPVRITVPSVTKGVLATFSNKRMILAGVIVLLTGVLLVFVLVVGGRIQPMIYGRGKKGGQKRTTRDFLRRRTATVLPSDPLTQPVEIQAEPAMAAGRHGWRGRRQRPPREPKPEALAILIPYLEAGEATLPAAQAIAAMDVTFGRDALQATIVLEDESVEALHARMQHEGNSFRIFDQGSIAGTWVNFAPVPAEGLLLNQEDLVHIGRVSFRFTLRVPGSLRKPKVTLLEEEAA